MESSKKTDNMKKIIVDTNFLMIPYAQKIDIFEEIHRLIKEKYELVTLKGVIKELERIIDGQENKGSDKIAAKIGLQLIEKKDIRVLLSQGMVDEEIINLSRKDKKNTIVCTNDKKLRKQLREAGITLIGMRSRNYLDFV